ncbi:hypothetical protein FS837_006785, partial [Tulasnella sp. UAMH 9824]
MPATFQPFGEQLRSVPEVPATLGWSAVSSASLVGTNGVSTPSQDNAALTFTTSGDVAEEGTLEEGGGLWGLDRAGNGKKGGLHASDVVWTTAEERDAVSEAKGGGPCEERWSSSHQFVHPDPRRPPEFSFQHQRRSATATPHFALAQIEAHPMQICSGIQKLPRPPA